MYLMTGTRTDLAFTIGQLASYVADLGVLHWKVLKRLLRYVFHTRTESLVLCRGLKEIAPVVYGDLDRTGDGSSRKSVSGYLDMMGNAPASYLARRQKVVALSSTQAEYRSLCSGIKEVM